MQLIELGRNEPCSCGSGRKYKKCCLAKRDAATAIDPAIAAAVDRAIEDDDWDSLYDPMNTAMTLFEAGEPLEHVRFRDDQIQSRSPDRAELAKLCTAGWLRRCELEIAYVLERYELDADVRDGLRLAVYLLGRFGANSPTVEEIARLQVAERVQRVRGFANAVSARGLTLEDVMAGGDDLASWVERVRPTVLSFADWFALRTAARDRFDDLWLSGVAARAGEACLDQLEDISVEDGRHWLDLGAVTLLAHLPPVGRMLAQVTAPRQVTANERTMYEAMIHKHQGETLRGIAHRIARETEDRDDFAGAALLRAAIQGVQSSRR